MMRTLSLGFAKQKALDVGRYLNPENHPTEHLLKMLDPVGYVIEMLLSMLEALGQLQCFSMDS